MGKKTLKEAVESILNENENADSLKPKSKSADGPKKLEGEVVDHGAAIDDVNGEKKDLAKSVKKSDEPGPKPPVGAEPMKKLSEEKDKKDEDDSDKDDDKDDDKDEDDKDDVSEAKEFEFNIDVKEDVAAMFAGQELSEEFKTKVSTIFEAALKTNLKKYKAVLDEEFDKALEVAVTTVAEDMDTKVEKYLNHVAEEWMQENEVAIESTLRTELTEDFIAGLRNLFLENYIDLPEDKVDVVENLSTQVDDLQVKLDEEIKKNIELKEAVIKEQRVNAVNALTEGMVATQVEKIKSLSEEIEFTNLEDFTSKVKTVMESYYPKTPVKKDTSMLNEESDPDAANPAPEVKTNPEMRKYVEALSRFGKN